MNFFLYTDILAWYTEEILKCWINEKVGVNKMSIPISTQRKTYVHTMLTC